MSVIIALKKDKSIYLGADTQRTCSNIRTICGRNENWKITAYKNGVLLGGVGSVRVTNAVRVHNEWFEKIEGELTKEYIVKMIVPQMMLEFFEKGLVDEKRKNVDASFVIAYKDKAFCITRELAVYEADGFCIGSGAEFAYPYLYGNSDDIKQTILTALRGVAKRDITIGAPFILIDSVNLKFEIVE